MSENTEVNKNIVLSNDVPKEFQSDPAVFVDYVETPKRGVDKALNNQNGSVSLRADGQINISPSNAAQIKANPNGTVESISLQEIITTNKLRINSDEIIVDNHKYNRKLYDFADYKKVLDTEVSQRTGTVGGLTMLGTVLTRSWDHNLNRYVMVRRLVNIPVFSPSLGIPKVHPGLKLNSIMDSVNGMYDSIKDSAAGIDSFMESVSNTVKDRQEARDSNESLASIVTNAKNQLKEDK